MAVNAGRKLSSGGAWLSGDCGDCELVSCGALWIVAGGCMVGVSGVGCDGRLVVCEVASCGFVNDDGAGSVS